MGQKGLSQVIRVLFIIKMLATHIPTHVRIDWFTFMWVSSIWDPVTYII